MQIRRLRASDHVDGFDSGDIGLDRYLHSFAAHNQDVLGIGVTYVVPTDGGVAGFVTLVAASVRRDDMPLVNPEQYPRYPLPALRIARLAVDLRAQGAGLGGALVAFTWQVADAMRPRVGCTGLMVDALPAAVPYYESLGFHTARVVEGSSAARPRPIPMWVTLSVWREFLRSE